MTKHVTDKEFNSEIASGLVLVDFWAQWCGPCKQLGPTLEAVSNEMGNKVKVLKVDIDDNPYAPQKYGVRSIPTMVVFKDGKEIGRKIGAIQKTALVEWLESFN